MNMSVSDGSCRIAVLLSVKLEEEDRTRLYEHQWEKLTRRRR